MAYPYFSHNGDVLPSDQAVVPLDNVAYSYGFGVYETIRAAKGQIYFLREHVERLIESARIIDLQHSYSAEFIQNAVELLVAKNEAEACNIKILLIGGRFAEEANLYIICLNPLYPDRKLYQTGAHCITYKYERQFPHAKTLNMLPSYLAYRDAVKAGAYDALLINRHGNIIEGTRTNFFALKGKSIYTPQESEILLGVTRAKVLEVAKELGFEIINEDIKLSEIHNYDNVFITSTSSKVMPIKSIDEITWETPSHELSTIMNGLDSKY